MTTGPAATPVLTAGPWATGRPASQPQTQYGLDAQRTVAWFAASCDPRAKTLAARWWPLLRSGNQAQAQALRPGGAVLDPSPAVLPMVASGAAAKAADNGAAAQKLLRRATAEQKAHPTYYGGAWDALGQALLSTGTLSSC